MRHLGKKMFPFAMFIVITSCGKEFLDVKRDASQVIPSSVADYQALLDRQSIMNVNYSVGLALIGSGEFRVSDEIFNALERSNPVETMAYIWSPDIFRVHESRDWNNAYQRILHANLALDVEQVDPADHELEAWKNVKGSALFYRAINYYHLLHLFCKPYDIQTAYMDEGLPLRLDYDVSIMYGRSSVGEVYDQVIADLVQALELLPEIASPKIRPSKVAALTLLAKVHLHMGNYTESREYCERALAISRGLVDFNSLDTNHMFTFESDYGESHPEVIFFLMENQAIMTDSRMQVEESVLELYDSNDLRKQLYFRKEQDGRTIFKGSYSGQDIYFAGLAIDEVYIVLAECHARLGDVSEAVIIMNELMENRYDEKTFKPLNGQLSKEEILQLVLSERQKELYMRGTRWEDLRRLNKEPQFATDLVRYVNGERYELPANDSRWVWPVPHNDTPLFGKIKND